MNGRKEKISLFPGVGTSGRGVGTRKGAMICIWWMYFVSIYKNRRMKSVEIVLRSGERR
jgi:hypothetical protein